MTIDLHCDLLGCVEADEKALNFHSLDTNCSLPQLHQGGVSLQTFAVATITGGKTGQKAERQVELYQELLKEIAPFKKWSPGARGLHGMLAIENASSLADEEEPLERAFERLDTFSKVEKILYVSLTWNDENRFGGGNATQVGLKPDGRALLEYMSGKGIAIDLSHTSDPLACDILDTIDRLGLHCPVIASHSNYRSVLDHPRNLPDELAQEVIGRKGVIGLNFVRRFVGASPDDFRAHLEYGLALGGEKAIALGADFYGGFPLPPDLLKDIHHPPFFPGYDNSSCYPKFFRLLKETFTEEQIGAITHGNVKEYLEQLSKGY